MSSVTYLKLTSLLNIYCAPMWILLYENNSKNLKKRTYNNSLRRFMGLQWHNSANEMFHKKSFIKLFGEVLRCFVYGFRSIIMIFRNLMLIGICNCP